MCFDIGTPIAKKETENHCQHAMRVGDMLTEGAVSYGHDTVVVTKETLENLLATFVNMAMSLDCKQDLDQDLQRAIALREKQGHELGSLRVQVADQKEEIESLEIGCSMLDSDLDEQTKEIKRLQSKVHDLQQQKQTLARIIAKC